MPHISSPTDHDVSLQSYHSYELPLSGEVEGTQRTASCPPSASLTKRVSFHEDLKVLLHQDLHQQEHHHHHHQQEQEQHSSASSSYSSIDRRMNKSRSNSGDSSSAQSSTGHTVPSRDRSKTLSMDSMDSCTSGSNKVRSSSQDNSILAAVWDQQQQSRLNRSLSKGQLLLGLLIPPDPTSSSSSSSTTPYMLPSSSIDHHPSIDGPMRKEPSPNRSGELYSTRTITTSTTTSGVATVESSPLLHQAETIDIIDHQAAANHHHQAGDGGDAAVAPVVRKSNAVMTEYLVSTLLIIYKTRTTSLTLHPFINPFHPSTIHSHPSID